MEASQLSWTNCWALDCKENPNANCRDCQGCYCLTHYLYDRCRNCDAIEKARLRFVTPSLLLFTGFMLLLLCWFYGFLIWKADRKSDEIRLLTNLITVISFFSVVLYCAAIIWFCKGLAETEKVSTLSFVIPLKFHDETDEIKYRARKLILLAKGGFCGCAFIVGLFTSLTYLCLFNYAFFWN